MPKKVSRLKKKVSSQNYENSVEEFFVNKLPNLPVGVKQFIVDFSPWIVAIMTVLALPAVLAVFGFGAMMAPFGYAMMGARWGYGYSINWLVSVISFGLSVMALPGLFKKLQSGWRLMLYSTVVTAIGSLLNGELISLIIGTGISLYILYQVKSYYK